MNTYTEAVLLGEQAALDDHKREELIRKAVTSALSVLDAEYPEFSKSKGPFGDKLAADLHWRIEEAFNELRVGEEKELTELSRLQGKYRS